MEACSFVEIGPFRKSPGTIWRRGLLIYAGAVALGRPDGVAAGMMPIPRQLFIHSWTVCFGRLQSSARAFWLVIVGPSAGRCIRSRHQPSTGRRTVRIFLNCPCRRAGPYHRPAGRKGVRPTQAAFVCDSKTAIAVAGASQHAWRRDRGSWRSACRLYEDGSPDR